MTNKKITETLKMISEISGMKKFFVQDTETTGLTQNDQIYEIAGVLYENGAAKTVHYYLERPKGVSYDVLQKKQGSKGSMPWENIISDAEYERIRTKGGKYKGGSYLPPDKASKFINDISKIPNITYNAVFDISMEAKLDKNIKFTDVYDAATLVVNTFPQILQIKDVDKGNLTGHWNLQHVYNYLKEPSVLKQLGINKNFPEDYGGKNLKKEAHTALSDTTDMLIPVLGVISEIFKQNPDWKWEKFKNKQAVPTYLMNKKGNDFSNTPLQPVTYSMDIIKKLGENAKGFLTLDKQKIQSTLGQHQSVGDLISSLPAGLVSGDDILKRIERETTGENKQTLKGLIKGVQSGGEFNTGKLLKDLDSSLRDKGFFVSYDMNKSSGELHVFLVPNDEMFLFQMGNKKTKPIQFTLNLTKPDGTINLDGRNAVNKLFSDYQNGKTVVLTAEQAQILDVLKFINKSGRFDGAIRHGKYENLGALINGEVRQAMHTLHTLQNYVSNDVLNEGQKDLSGTGSARQRWIRENYLDNSRYLTHIIEKYEDELVKACLRQGFSGVYDEERALEHVLKDLNDMLNIMGTLSQEDAEKEWVRHRKRLGYLTEGNVWKHIQQSFKELTKLKFHPGISGENSVARLTTSLISAKDLTPSGMTRMDTRHQQQIAATRALTDKASQYRKTQKFKGRIFNEFEIQQTGINVEAEQEALSSYSYIRQDDINRAYKKVRATHKDMSEREFIRKYGTGNVGIHNDASLFMQGSDFQTKYLEAYRKTTKTIDADYFEAKRRNKIISLVKKGERGEKGGLKCGYSAKELREQLKSGDTYEIDKLFGQLYKEHQESIDLELAKSIIYDDNNFSNVPYKKFRIKEFKFVGGNKYRATVYLPSPADSGLKILSKVDGLRTNAQGIHEEVYRAILEEKGLTDVDLLKELPKESFSSEEIEGLIIGYLNRLVSVSIEKQLNESGDKKQKSALNKVGHKIGKFINDSSSPIKGLMVWDIKQKSFIMKNGVLENAIINNKLDGVLNTINKLGLECGVPEGFEKVAEGQWAPTSKYVGMSAVNQAEVDEYGDPAITKGGVAKFDYRAIQALESAIILADMSNKKAGSRIESYIMQQIKVDQKALENYNNIKKNIETANKLSLMSGTLKFEQTDMQQRKMKAVSVGYGSNYMVDLSKYGTSLYENGRFSQDLYNKSIFNQIEQAKEKRAQELGISSKEVEVYLDLEKTYSKIQSNMKGSNVASSVRYLFLPNLNPLSDDWRNMDFPDLPRYITEFNSLVSGINAVHDMKDTLDVNDARINQANERIRTKVFDFIDSSFDAVNWKESSIYEKGHTNKVTHTGSGVATAGNASWILDKEASALQRRIASTDGMMNFEDAIAIMMKDEADQSSSKAEKVKKQKAHLNILGANAIHLWEDVSEENIKNALAESIASYIEKQTKRSKGMSDEEYKNKLSDVINSPETEALKQDLLTLLGFGSNKIEDIDISDFKYYERLNSYLANFIADSVTVGSIVMESRVHQERALAAILGRYPFSNGLDLKFSQLYIDKGVVKGRITLGLGVGRAFNLDFDGDHVPYWLNMFSSESRPGESLSAQREKWKEMAQEFEDLKQWQRKITSFLAVTEAKGIVDDLEPQVYASLEELKLQEPEGKKNVLYYTISNGTAYVWDNTNKQYVPRNGIFGDKQVNELFAFQSQVRAVLAGRKYKGQTGAFSNLYQAIANAMHEKGIDEKGLTSNDPVKQRKAIRALIVRAFYESFTQDAISSKKVFNRLKERNGTTESFLWDLDELILSLKSDSTYTDVGLTQLFKKLEEMGLSSIQERILVQVLVTSRVLDESGEIFKETFGIDPHKFNIQYNEDGTIKSFNGIEKQGEREKAIIDSVKDLLDKENGVFSNGEVIKRVLLEVNEDFKDMGLKGIAKVGSNKDFKPGSSPSGMYDYGEALSSAMEQATEEAQRAISKQWKKIQKAQALLKEKPVTPFKKGSIVKLEKSLLDFRESIKNFNEAEKDAIQFSIKSISTGLDPKGHKTFLRKEDFPFKSEEDIENYNFLQSLIDSKKVYSVTQLAGALHIGDYEKSNTYALSYGTLVHAIIEVITKNTEDNIANKKLAEVFNQEVINASLAKETLKQWIHYKWLTGNEEDQMSVIAAIVNDDVDEKTLEKALRAALGFIEQTKTLGFNERRALTEYTQGLVVRNGQESFIISGTIDQLWLSVENSRTQWELSDVKTSAYPYLEYVMQLSLYNAILRVSGKEVSKNAKLLMNNINGSDTVFIESLSDDQVFEFIKEAVKILQTTNLDERKVLVMQLASKWNPKLLSQMTQSVSRGEDGKFLYGGATLSTALLNLNHDFPLTQKELDLISLYQNAKTLNFQHTETYEEYVYALYHSGKLSKEDYGAHLNLRGYRAQIVQNYINTFATQTERQAIQEAILAYARRSNSEEDIGVAYAMAIQGDGKHKIDFVDIDTYQSQMIIDDTTYNYNDLKFKSQAKEEEEMADAQEIAQAIMGALSPWLGNSGVTSPSRSSTGIKSIVKGGARVPDSEILSLTNGKQIEELKTVYEQQLHAKEMAEMKLQLEDDEIQRRDQERALKEKYAGIDENGNRLTYADGTAYGIFARIEEKALALLKKAIGGDTTKNFTEEEAEQEAQKIWDSQVEQAKENVLKNIDYENEKRSLQADIDSKSFKEKEKSLEKQKKLYEEILVLQERISVISSKGDQESLDILKEKLDLKEQEYALQDSLTEEEKGLVGKESAEKIANAKKREENSWERTNKSQYKRYRSLVENKKLAESLGKKKEAQNYADLLDEEFGDKEVVSRLEKVLPVSIRKEMDIEAEEARKKTTKNTFETKFKEYKSKLRSVENVDKQIYANEQRYKLTYSKAEREALNQERSALLEQKEVTEQEVARFFEENQDIISTEKFQNEKERIEKASQANLERNRKSVDVRNRGQHNLWGQLGEQVSGIMTRFTQYGAAYKVIGSIRNGINQVTTSAKELDKAMTDLRIVSGQNRKEANSTMRAYADLASQLGMTTTEIATAGNEWLRQGYAINEVNELIEASAYLSKLGMIDMGSAVEKITSALKGFKIEATDAMDVVDKFTALDVKAATTAGDIAEGLSEFANVASLNGVDIDEASAIVATIADVSQSSGSEVGNAMKTILSRYSNVKSGSFSDMMSGDADTEGLNDVEKVLKQIGITIRDSELGFRDFTDVLDDLSVKWQTLDNITQNAIASALGGRQV